MDIRCVRLQPFDLDGRILVSSEVIIPLPEAEQYRLSVQRKRREVIETQAKTKAGRLVPRLIDAGALQVGDTLYLKKALVPKEAAPAWSKSEPAYQAVVATSEGTRTLRWRDPETGEDELVSPSLLAARFIWRFEARADPISSAGINGMLYWTLDGQKSLRDLATEHGLLDGANRTVDKVMLRQVSNAIPPGRWSTYGDVASAIGVPGAAQPVAGVIATDSGVENPHRILRANGQISPGWTDADLHGPEHARSLLEAEGVSFDETGIAPPDRRWNPADLT